MTQHQAKFDGLADNYDRTRPRYPAPLFAHVIEFLPRGRPLNVVDAGGGTGIALEALMPMIPGGSKIHGVDISADMIRLGKSKFPEVAWHLQGAEEYLESQSSLDLVIAAQAYQWMDRSRFLAAAFHSLASGGVCMIVQNNRDHQSGSFAAAYEDLLEAYSPGYDRNYRAIDIAGELASVFPRVEQYSCSWNQVLTTEEFITMSSSSTQAQRAIDNIGSDFFSHLRTLCSKYEIDGCLTIAYVSEAYFGITKHGRTGSK